MGIGHDHCDVNCGGTGCNAPYPRKVNLYGHHDSDYEAFGSWFARHMDRMTAEQLDGKAEIAWELAHRDHVIDDLREALRNIADNTSGLPRRAATQALEIYAPGR